MRCARVIARVTMHNTLVVLLCTVAVRTAIAQDRRTVKEPSIPAPCATLSATLHLVGDSTLADADERRLDTERVQQAIDRCSSGHSVVLAVQGDARAFLSGPLKLKEGVTLNVDKGAVLFASRDARLYDVRPGSCGVVHDKGSGCQALIEGNGAAHAGVMGDGVIDGRGWAKVLGQTESWWELAQRAKVENRTQNCPRLMVLRRSNDFTLYRIALRNSPNFHVVFERGDGFTAWGVVINTPKTARNTDGIDPSGSTNVTITHSWISTGDDNVALKAGSAGAMTNVTVAHNHFYLGHGMSIGSETNAGVSAIRVTDLSIDGADNGLRIKSNGSRGGLVHDVTYEDVCIQHTKDPVYMDTHYSASPELDGNLIPEYHDITLRNVRVLDGGTITLEGYDGQRRLGMIFDNVVFDSLPAITVVASHADIHRGPGPMALPVHGTDVHMIGDTRAGAANSCEGKFPPMVRR